MIIHQKKIKSLIRNIPTYQFRLIIVTLVLVICNWISLSAEIKSLWVTAWDLNCPDKIDRVVEFAQENNISQLLVHARYRGDALYQPNRIYDTFFNPEPRSYILADDIFDPLAYIINRTRGTNIEIHAWVTVFVVTPRIIDNLSLKHVYFTHPHWITRDIFGNQMSINSHEGAYLDPGIPEVQDYLIDVFKDIVINYNIAGIHLDYIRYPDSQYGYAELAKEQYYEMTHNVGIKIWKQKQITRFVRRCYAEVKSLDPQIIVSAATVSDLDRAKNRYSQNWTNWLDEQIIDYAYSMTYGLEDHIVENELKNFKNWNDRIIVGLRAWDEAERRYFSKDVVSKIDIIRRNDYLGLSLFSFYGLHKLMDYKLKNSLMTIPNFSPDSDRVKPISKNYIFGYVKDGNGDKLNNVKVILKNGETTLSDNNGFFMFPSIKPGSNRFKAEIGVNVFFSDYFYVPNIFNVNSARYDIVFWTLK